jgi:hypothetical protein
MKFAKVLNVKITFTEPVLGTAPNNEDLYAEYIASKAPTADKVEEEIEAFDVNDEIQKGMTVFPRTEDGKPFIWDYQIKGFFKDSCGGLRKVASSESAKIKAFKKEIDKLIFPFPRQISFENVRAIEKCERPLRAATPQGERVSLVCSEQIPAGATLTFSIGLMDDTKEAAVREWLDYGEFSGLGQWRNSGKGRFTWEEI